MFTEVGEKIVKNVEEILGARRAGGVRTGFFLQDAVESAAGESADFELREAGLQMLGGHIV